MGAPQKYLFDLSFDQSDATAAARAPAAQARKPPPEPTFTQAELEAARAAGFAEGQAAAAAEAHGAVEARIAAAVEALARDMGAALTAQGGRAETLRRDATAALRAIAQKVVPALCRAQPLVEIEALLGDCLRDAVDEPRLVLRVAGALFEPLQARLEPLAAAAGYAGKVVLLADDALQSGDCRIEWADGGAERDTRRLLRDIDAALARAIDTVTAPAPSHLQETPDE